MLAQLRALFRAVVEQRKMRPLGHEHDAFITQVGGLVDERIERQMRLSPGTRITDRMYYRGTTHRKNSLSHSPLCGAFDQPGLQSVRRPALRQSLRDEAGHVGHGEADAVEILLLRHTGNGA